MGDATSASSLPIALRCASKYLPPINGFTLFWHGIDLLCEKFVFIYGFGRLACSNGSSGPGCV
jgi:hypothetical protein